MNEDREFEETLRRIAGPVDHRGVWAGVQKRAGGHAWDIGRPGAGAGAEDKPAGERKGRVWWVPGPRVAVVATVVVALAAAVTVGSLEAVRYLGGEQPIVVLTDETIPDSGAATVSTSADSLGMWQRMPLSVEGGTIQALVMDPRDPSILYAGTDDGLFRTTDGAKSWSEMGQGWSGVRMIAVDPNAPNNIYARFFDGEASGLYRSEDGGDTWSGVPEKIGGLTRGLWFDTSTSPSTAYISTGFISGLFRSRDGGATWMSVEPGILEPDEIAELVIDPAGKLLYALVTDGGAPTLQRSFDLGATWEDISSQIPVAARSAMGAYDPSPAPGGRYLCALRVDPADTSHLYLGAGENVLVSADGGATWVEPSDAELTRATSVLNTAPGTPEKAIEQAAVSIADLFDGVVLAAKPAQAFTEASVSGARGPVLVDSREPSTLYMGTDQGVFKSEDAGHTWRKASGGIFDPTVSQVLVEPSSPSTLFALTSAGIMKSNDAGSTWQTTQEAPTLSMIIAPSPPWTLYASTTGGIMRSDDGGASWSSLPGTGLPTTAVSIEFVWVASDDANTLYANVSGSEPAADGLYRSADGGASWSKTLGDLTALVRVITESPGDPSILYADTFPDGLYRSRDHGQAWTQISPLALVALAVDPYSPTIMYGEVEAAGGCTTYVLSKDAGATWEEADTSGLPARVEWLLCDPRTPGLQYAVTYTEPDGAPFGTWVYRSTNGGKDWQDMRDGLPLAYPGLVTNPAAGGGLYAATDEGLYKWIPRNTR